MRRRKFVAGIIGLGIAAPCLVSAQALFRTVVQVDSSDPDLMQSALNIVQEAGRYHVAHRENAEIRVIAVGDGLTMLRADISPLPDRVSFITRSLPIVSWYASAQDISAITAEMGAPPPLLPDVMVVERGRDEVIRLRDDGWSVINP